MKIDLSIDGLDIYSRNGKQFRMNFHRAIPKADAQHLESDSGEDLGVSVAVRNINGSEVTLFFFELEDAVQWARELSEQLEEIAGKNKQPMALLPAVEVTP